MRATAFAFVVLTAACTDVSDQVDNDPLLRAPARGTVSPGHGNRPTDEIIDVDLFPFMGGGNTVATSNRGGTPCDDLDAGTLQTFADENLGCGTCYAMACGGEVAAHVCTRACGDTLPQP